MRYTARATERGVPLALNVDEAKRKARDTIEGLRDEAEELSLSIHSTPELNFEEHHAHDLLTGYLEKAGWVVQRAAYGMETAFRASAGSGSPAIAIFCEYDALPGIGHACGHNLIAAAGVAAAIGMRAALGEGNGEVVVLGSPAEEGGGGKIYMLREGALDGIDAAMMVHPTPADSAWADMIAIGMYRIEYFGRGAHAAAFPWLGLNALDAVVMAYNAISAMRQQFRPTDRAHGIITDGGVKPNIIPDYAAAEYYFRARTVSELEELRARVLPCFEAAATATGCRMEISQVSVPYKDVRTNDTMAEAYVANMAELGLTVPGKLESAPGMGGASTDMGDVSYAVPSIHPLFGIQTHAVNHTAEFTTAAATREANDAMLRAAKAMAMTGIDLCLRPGLLENAKREFHEISTG